MTNARFAALAFAVAAVFIAGTMLVPNDYYFSAAYTVLQFVILATAWNVLGGYAGYVNFGSAAFFAVGAYSSVFLYKAVHPPLIVSIATGTVVAGLLGMAVGYLTLRLRGVFFAIATLALAVVLYTCVVNWDYVRGARRAYILPSKDLPFGPKPYHPVPFFSIVV